MNRLAESLYSITVTMWVGGLFAIGFLVAPVLFAQLPDHALAGNLAGTLFTLIAIIGFVCGGYLIMFLFVRQGLRAFKCGVLWIVLLMLVLNAAGHFGIQPIITQLNADALPRQVMESALRDRFAAWHGISSVLYLVQTLFGFALAVIQEQGKR